MKICSQCKAVLGQGDEVCPSDGAPSTEVHTLPAGAILGAYRIVGELGDGGMGVVYEAVHEVLGRRSALKLLRPEYAKNNEIVTRFLQEAKAVNLINNKHIVNVYDYGDDVDGLVYFVMEYLEGQTLAGLMKEYAPMPPALFCHVFLQVLQGLAAAHENQIVHRDLKFENVFVIAKGTNPLFVKLLDFGIAKLRGEHSVEGLTGAGQLIGTPKFMSPEQFRGKPVDARSDVFSLGIMMYAASTGAMPFAGKELGELAAGIIKERQIPAHERLATVPTSISALIERALEKDAAARFPDARAMQASLMAIRDAMDPSSAQITAFLREHIGDPDADVGLDVLTPPPPSDVEAAPSSKAPSSKAPGPKAPLATPKPNSKRMLNVGIAAALAVAAGGAFVAFSKDSNGAGAAKFSDPEPVVSGAPVQSALAQAVGLSAAKTRAVAVATMKAQWGESKSSDRLSLVQSLAAVGSPASAGLLIGALAEEPPTALAAAHALAEFSDEATKEAIAGALESATPQVRIALGAALERHGDTRARSALEALLNKPRQRTAAALALTAGGTHAASVQVLRDVFTETPAWKGRWLDAASGLVQTGDAAAAKVLVEALEGDSPENRFAAAQALALVERDEGAAYLSDLVADARSLGRGAAALVLARCGHEDAQLFVPVGLMSDDDEAKVAAMAVLSRLGGEPLRKQADRLLLAAESKNPVVSMAALAALANLPTN